MRMKRRRKWRSWPGVVQPLQPKPCCCQPPPLSTLWSRWILLGEERRGEERRGGGCYFETLLLFCSRSCYVEVPYIVNVIQSLFDRVIAAAISYAHSLTGIHSPKHDLSHNINKKDGLFFHCLEKIRGFCCPSA